MRKPNYECFPAVEIKGFTANVTSGYENICSAILRQVKHLNQAKSIIAIECYPGTLDEEILPALRQWLSPQLVIESQSANYSHAQIYQLIQANLTEDRVRGKLSLHTLPEFFDQQKINQLRNQIDQCETGIILIYGTGASLITKPDLLVYADLARWEIQLRYRAGSISNWCADNYKEDFLLMYKRGYFVDWRVADRHKVNLFDQIDFLLDTNKANQPKMVSGEAFRSALSQVAQQPFRTVPYFDAGPWGGQWMKEVCDLERNMPNYAWCFDGVPEENSLLLKFGATTLEIPSLDVVLYQPKQLLGEQVYARFGAEFPIRFDFLDTMGGGNLSLQVHPTTGYIQNHFGMHYTQDESYYILDAGDDACVYLGTKTGIDPNEMIHELEEAQTGTSLFNVEKYINKIPAKKHDHFLIPGGTIHCSGANSMVLEISATPYIFTFKLWDWGRLGMDGKPRPIHIEHGKNVINWEWDSEAIAANHVNCIEKVAEGSGWLEERTGLHALEFIETRRYWFSQVTSHHTEATVNVLNLVEGEEVIVESPTNKFTPFVVHYAETFIIPAAVGEYSIRPWGKALGSTCAVIKAYVRS